MIKVKCHQHQVVSRWFLPGNRTFLEVACIVVTWWIVFFSQLPSISGINTQLSPYNHQSTKTTFAIFLSTITHVQHNTHENMQDILQTLLQQISVHETSSLIVPLSTSLLHKLTYISSISTLAWLQYLAISDSSLFPLNPLFYYNHHYYYFFFHVMF